MRILVTGAGGSIGSALCKRLQADEVILYEWNEYALYQINEELTYNRKAVLGDIKDQERLKRFMRGVDVVYHCAAYKHVPMCEGINSDQAWLNNVHGTACVLSAASNAKSVVLLSTDKAILPKGEMGKTKMEAERLTLLHGRTVARLGNILESSGSVIPKFRKQIEAGGPVTVTHPETTRYFIPMDKAVDFLIDCSSREPGAYMVEMGSPRKILDIAREMIGEREIDVEFIGLRPGEKLHEDIA